jgi:hypothetical protein
MYIMLLLLYVNGRNNNGGAGGFGDNAWGEDGSYHEPVSASDAAAAAATATGDKLPEFLHSTGIENSVWDSKDKGTEATSRGDDAEEESEIIQELPLDDMNEYVQIQV